MATKPHKPRIMPKDIIRGQKWEYKRAYGIIGVIDAIHIGGYVHVDIDVGDDGEMTWISKIDAFLERWSRVSCDTPHYDSQMGSRQTQRAYEESLAVRCTQEARHGSGCGLPHVAGDSQGNRETSGHPRDHIRNRRQSG